MRHIKKVVFVTTLSALMVVASVFILQIAQAQQTHQDIYEHHHWDHTGEKSPEEPPEIIGATDENATTRATYVVLHILDVNGQNHTLWYSHKYESKQSDGTWVETGSGSVSIWVVIQFFINHLGDGN